MRRFSIGGLALIALLCAAAYAQTITASDATSGNPAGHVELNLADAPLLGSLDAPLTIVEYDDFQCPVCHGFFLSVFGALKKNYIETGKVRFYNRDLPLDTIHPNALRAAQAGRCAIEQGKFWELHDLMNGNPEQLDLTHILNFAQTAGLDSAALKKCVASGKYTKAIRNDVQEAAKLGIPGTPAFVIGKSTSKGVTGELLPGARTYPEFDRRLKILLANAAR